MNISILFSSSKGNLYKIDDGHTSILLECGVSIKEIKKALNFKLNSIDSVIISHQHNDHSKALKGILSLGIETYCNLETATAHNVIHNPYLHIIKPDDQFQIGSFKIKAFAVRHDVPNLGFYIKSTDTNETLLFAVDTHYIDFTFPNLTHIMVECSYNEDILKENVSNEVVNAVYAERLRRSHFALHNVLEFLKSNDLSKCEKIYLLHFSSQNSNKQECVNRVQSMTGIPVYTN